MLNAGKLSGKGTSAHAGDARPPQNPLSQHLSLSSSIPLYLSPFSVKICSSACDSNQDMPQLRCPLSLPLALRMEREECQDAAYDR